MVSMCVNGNPVCVSVSAAQTLLANDPNARLGPCPKSLIVPEAHVSLYPNPSNGQLLMLSMNNLPVDVERIAIDVYDLAGTRVHAELIPTQGEYLLTEIGINGSLAAGVYMVNIIVGNEIYYERLVIQP
jgi:hypothetical protein